MQNLITMDEISVIVQADEKTYQEETTTFLDDYGKPVPYQQIDYNQATKHCYLNGAPFQPYPNEICEDILASIDTLMKKKEAREVQQPAPTLEELKAEKLQAVDDWTAGKITGGFISECSGEPVRYDSDVDTQITMQGIALNVNTEQFAEKYPAGCPVRGVKEGDTAKTIQYLSAAQVLAWCADLSIHIGTCKQAGWEKQAQVAAAQSQEDLESIVLA